MTYDSDFYLFVYLSETRHKVLKFKIALTNIKYLQFLVFTNSWHVNTHPFQLKTIISMNLCARKIRRPSSFACYE